MLCSFVHPLAAFVDQAVAFNDALYDPVSYWYEGDCPQTGDRLRLPRTVLAEAIAQGLMRQLSEGDRHEGQAPEGKMYGILLVELPSGARGVLKAFSGLWNGDRQGWVPPIPGREQVALEETRTLGCLATMKQELIALQHLPERQQYKAIAEEFASRRLELARCQAQRKQERQLLRQHLLRQHLDNTLTAAALADALEALDNQSRREGSDRRRLQLAQAAALRPLKSVIDRADAQMQQLKQQRKTLSRQLQSQLYAAYSLTNFAGDSLSLQALSRRISSSWPTGTGECCAPKLLHFAATQGLKPLSMAEFWWGAASQGDKMPGRFYGACAERCQPLMGFLLSGLSQPGSLPQPGKKSSLSNGAASKISPDSLPILYQDDWLIAVDKPAGLLSVPGRYSDRQDSVLSRLRHQLPSGDALTAVHRLDQETSGILLLARDQATARHLRQQFQQRQICKVYTALLSGYIALDQGLIDLPLAPDPDDRPRQQVDWQRGKPSQTHFRVIARAADVTRVEFRPVTGRTHQLRVHAAHAAGLGVPILGDRLYGCGVDAQRLHLHAQAIELEHPQLQQTLSLQADPIF
ncbi:MAG TPA: RluA family pseudouridine synthase [Coleofasciculaceae cyanobacterium]